MSPLGLRTTLKALGRLSRRKAAAGAARTLGYAQSLGGVAQLGERLLCKQEAIGSIPFTSTSAAPEI